MRCLSVKLREGTRNFIKFYMFSELMKEGVVLQHRYPKGSLKLALSKSTRLSNRKFYGRGKAPWLFSITFHFPQEGS